MKNFLIYRSSAGSGKTYTLVKEYLKLVLSEPDSFKNVLAVTFTNKSSAEMKSRIITSLVKLSRGEDENLKQNLLKEGLKVNIETSSSEVLKNILHRYSYFSVSTIDSFFHRVIRSFAKELKLQLGYNIELDQNAVLDKITDKLLNDTGVDADLTKFIEAFIYFSIDDEKGWNIDRKIKDIAGEIFTERYRIKTGSDNVLLNSREKLNEFIGILFAVKNDFESRMKLIAEDSAGLMKHYGLTMEDFPFKKTGFINYLINKIAHGDYEPGSRAREAAEDINKWTGKTTSPDVKKAADAGLFDLLNSAIENYDKNYFKYNSAVQLIKTIYITGIFGDLINKLKDYRDENKILLISDVNNLLLSVISGNSSPFIYEKTGSYYKNFLIDEFQDTSTFQWLNFKPLIENSLSENNTSVIAGDLKQSIYRWRNGNMKLLLEQVKNDLVLFADEIKEETLNTNFRSKRTIIEFNNLFFKRASEISAENAPEGTGGVILKAYENTAQTPRKNADGGYVNISFCNNDPDADVSSREISIQNAITEIKHLLKKGYRQKDIMLLVRRNSDALEAAHALIDSRLRVISSDSLLLTNSPKVRLLVNMLIYLTDSNNAIAKTEILYNYLIYIQKINIPLNDIFTDHLQEKDTLFNKYIPSGLFENTPGGKLKNNLSSLAVYDLTEELIKIFNIGDSADTYLLRFLDVVKEYSEKFNTGIYGFLRWWEENKSGCTIIVPEEEDAIRVMTIHKAKGLQAPVVFIPYANWELDLNGSRDMIWVSSEKSPFNVSPAYFVKALSDLKNTYFADDYNEESMLTNLDNLNMMYVAFTRAEKRLYISIPEKGRKTNNAGELIRNTLDSVPELSSKFDPVTNCFETGDAGISCLSAENITGSAGYKIKDIIPGNTFEKIVIKPGEEIYSAGKTALKSKQINRGIMMHKALSLLTTGDDEDINITADMMRLSGYIAQNQKDNLINELKELLSIEKVKSWFSGSRNSFSEKDIILPGGSIYRPDRVLINGKNATVIDYKTGSKSKLHEDQIREYGDILVKMGYENIILNLFYINDKEITEVKLN